MPAGSATGIVLYKPTPDAPGATSYEHARSQIGTFAPVALGVDDCKATYAELTARGVEFTMPPDEQPFGTQAMIRDPDGNTILLIQRTGLANSDGSAMRKALHDASVMLLK